MKTVRSFIEKSGAPKPRTVRPEESISLALRRMKRYNIGALPVVGKGNKLLGIFSERDYSRACCSKQIQSLDLGRPVSSIMTPVKQVTYVFMDTTIDECCARMDAKKVRHLPVVDRDLSVVGVISMRDLLHAIVSGHQIILDNIATSMGCPT